MKIAKISGSHFFRASMMEGSGTLEDQLEATKVWTP